MNSLKNHDVKQIKEFCKKLLGTYEEDEDKEKINQKESIESK